MGKKYIKEIMIGPSLTDASGKLSFANCFGLFMDIATEHAEELGIGQSSFGKKGLFWLTAKSKLRFYRRPDVVERVSVSTWPESHEYVKCIRNYRLTKGEEVLAEGRTLWTVIDMAKGALVDIGELYPDDFNVMDESFMLEGFTKINTEFKDEPFAIYKVSSNDIDLGKHMNNVAYIRAIQSVFSTEEWNRMDPDEVEIQFIKPCFEGEVMELRKVVEDHTMYIKGSVGERTVILLKIIL